MVLAADVQREYSRETLEKHQIRGWPVVATDIIYAGAAVTINASGHAKPLATGDEQFAGFAAVKADNAAGAAAAIDVDVFDEGHVVLTVTGTTAASVGLAVLASDDGTFTVTQPSGGDHPTIGKVERFIGADGVPGHVATSCLVFFQADHRRLAVNA